MKTLISIISLVLYSFSFGQLEDFESEQTKTLPIFQKVEPIQKKKDTPYNVNFDWMLDTKTEVINGIWYSPSFEFNINRPNGVNFHLQTGALPTLKGFKLDKTQPSAALAFRYTF